VVVSATLPFLYATQQISDRIRNVMKGLVSLLLPALVASSALAAPLGSESPRVDEMTWVDLAYAGDRVVAVGDRGNVLLSDDQGKTWRMGNTPTQAMLTAVCFADEQNGWAVGHDAIVLATTDGGETWTQQYSDPLGGGEEEEDFSEEEEYSDDIYSDDIYSDDIYSSDPYAEESAMPAVDTSGAPFLDVWCDTGEHVIAVGGFGYVLETSNAGDTWEKRMETMANPDGWHLYAIAPVPGNDGTVLVAGERGTLFRSRDHGKSWERLQSPYEGTFFGVTATANQAVLAYGLQGNVWLSRDLGETWQQVKTGISRGVSDGAVLEDGTIVLVGNSGVMLTSHDGGSSMSLRYTPARESLSAVLARQAGGVITAGAAGVRIIENLH
jgi:photosystem II stability/assembly factor-like uncharacterized protein